MSYKEFTQESKRTIVTNGMLIEMHRVRECMWLIEVSLPSLPMTIGDAEGNDWVSCTSVVTEMEAYHVHENLLNCGRK